MTLEEALINCKDNQVLQRKKWIEKGSTIKLMSSSTRLEDFYINLSEESMNADDWLVKDYVDEK